MTVARLVEEYVRLPRALFPDADAARALLGRVFPDREVRPTDAPESHWRFLIQPRSREAALHDPALSSNLASIFGLTLDDMAGWHRLGTAPLWLQAFDHCWALLAWSHWFAAQPGEPARPRPLLVHLDAHDDLASPPLIAERPHVFSALVGEEEMDLAAPETVARFLARGLVGIGGFIVPLLASLGGCDFIHVVPGGSRPDLVPPRPLPLCWDPAPVGTSSRQVHCVLPTCETPCIPAPFTYARVADLDTVADLDDGRPILLDIDLDYLALLPSREPPDQPSRRSGLVEALGRLEQLDRFLERGGRRGRIAATTVAYSPGFFPSSLWPEVIPRLQRILGIEEEES
jgi:hypothetical protein